MAAQSRCTSANHLRGAAPFGPVTRDQFTVATHLPYCSSNRPTQKSGWKSVSDAGVPLWLRDFQNQPRLRASSLISGIHCDVSRIGYADRTGTLPELPSSFQPGGSLDFMVRYLTSRSKIRLTNRNALTELVSRVEKNIVSCWTCASGSKRLRPPQSALGHSVN
jgi:hypothetical protein